MPNEQKKCSECQFEEDHSQACSKYVEDMPFTPTEEKIEYTKIAEGTPFEITQIKPTPTEPNHSVHCECLKCFTEEPTVSKWEEEFEEEFGIHFKDSVGELDFAKQFIKDLLSSKLDIDEVIGMIEGMEKDTSNLLAQQSLVPDIYNSALSSLKQKLEAKRKEI